MDMVRELEKRLEYDKENTSLPENPDKKKIDEFVMDIHDRIVKEAEKEYDFEM